jgi:uncharacterized protein
MKKLFLVLSFVVMASMSFFAQQVPAAYTKSLKELFELNGTEETFITAIDQMMEMFETSRDDVPADVWKALGDEFSKTSLNDLVEMLAPVYHKHLTIDDLNQIIVFYKTPAGKKLAMTTPAITQESMQIGQQWGMKVGQKVEDRLREKGY